MTEHDITGAYDPPPIGQWPDPADDPETEPEEEWAKDDPNPSPDPKP